MGKHSYLWRKITMSTTLPNATALQQAQYSRVGNDLQIKIAQETITIQDYFKQPFPLTTADGKQITVEEITAQLIQANTTDLGDVIGHVTTVVNGPISAESSNGQVRTLQTGDPIYLHDTLFTAPQSYIKITLIDNSVFQLGPLSKARLDQYSYNPQAPEEGGHLVGELFIGLFRFISGEISNDQGEQHTTFNTPSATIGIRGSEIDAKISSDGSTTLLHTEGLVQVTPHYIDQLLTIYEPGTLVYIPIGPIPPSVHIATPEEILQIRSQLAPLHMPIDPGQKEPDSSQSSPNLPNEGGRVYPNLYDDSKHKDQLSAQEEHDIQQDIYQQNNINGIGEIEDKTPITEQTLPPDDIVIPSIVTVTEDSSLRIELNLPKGELIDFTQPLHGNVFNNWDGSVTYTPQFGYIGQDYFQVQAIDDISALQIFSNQGFAKTSHNLNLLAVNDNDDNLTYKITPQGNNTYQIEVTIKAQLINLQALGNEVEYTQPLYGKLQEQADGQLRYLPPEDFHGVDSFTYRATPQADFIKVEFQIEPINDPPIIQDDKGITVAEDTPLTITPDQLLANDQDVDGDSLSIFDVRSLFTYDESGRQIDLTHGSIFWNSGSGQIEFLPTKDYFGEAQFSYTIEDSGGGRSTATVTITITPVNDAPVTQQDQITIYRTEPTVIDTTTLLANDTDVEQEPLRVTRVENAQNGTVSLGNNGEIVFIPDPLFVRGSFDYFVTDDVVDEQTGQLTETKGTVQLETPYSNGLIKAQDDALTLTTNPFIITTDQLFANDSGNNVQITQVGQAVNGNVALQNDNTILFTPNTLFSQQQGGYGSFQYTIATHEGNTSTANVTITGHIPTIDAKPNAISVGNGQSIKIPISDLLADDSSEDGNLLTLVSVQNGEHGTVILDGDYIIFTRDDSFTGDGSFSYTVTDGKTVDTAQVVITGTETVTNQAPNAQNDIFYLDRQNSYTFNAADLLQNDTDVDSDVITILSVNETINGTVTLNPEGTITFIPNEQYDTIGTAAFAYTIDDSHGNTAQALVELVSKAAVTANDDAITVFNNAPQSIAINTLLSNDNNISGGELHVISVQDPKLGEVVINGDTIVFTPSTQFNCATDNQAEFSYTIENKDGFTATAQVHLTASPMPPSVHTDEIVVKDNEPLIIDVNSLLNNDEDPYQQALTILSVNDAIGGTVELKADNTIVFTPNEEFATTHIGGFSYTANNGCDSATTTVSIRNDNTPPTAVDDLVLINTLDSTEIKPDVLLSNDTDADNDSLHIVAVTDPISGTVELTETGTILFTPNEEFINTGIGGFMYTITDDNGSQASAVVTLHPQNHAPIAASDTFNIVINEPTLFKAEDLLANDTDLDNDSLTITAVSDPVAGNVEILEDGTIQFTPTDDFLVTKTGGFTYTVDDGQGGSDSAIVTLTYENSPPTAQDDQLNIATDAPTLITVESLLANDSDLDDDAITLTEVTQPIHGTVELVDAAHIQFTPDDEFINSKAGEFTYTITDTAGNQATATVTLTAINQPPTANDDEFTVTENAPIIIRADELLANDSDPEQDIFSLIKASNAMNGEVVLNPDQTVTFTPNETFSETGVASFVYLIADELGGKALATVKLLLDKPQIISATDDTITTPNVEPIVIPSSQLISNDIGENLTIVSFGRGVINGSVELTPEGDVLFTPKTQFAIDGVASFSYLVSDGEQSAIGLVQVLMGNNTAPVGIDDEVSIEQDALSVAIPQAQLLANDSDAENDILTISTIKAAVNGFAEKVSNEIIFFPDSDFTKTGQGSFQYILTDNKGGIDTVTVNIVQAENPTILSAVDSITSENEAVMLFSSEDLAIDLSNVSMMPHSEIYSSQEKETNLSIADVLNLPDETVLIIEDNSTDFNYVRGQEWTTAGEEKQQSIYGSYNVSEPELLINVDIQNQFVG